MPASAVGTTWSLVTEDRATVLAALARGECDGLIPAASGFMDEFAGFLHEHGIWRHFEQFADPRDRHSIGVAFFCNVLLHKCLFRLDHLSDIGPVLFHSPDVLRRLGFNLRQVHEGFYQGSEQRPFNPEALADFFAALSASELQEQQKKLSAELLREFPEVFGEGIAVLDANTTTVPGGRGGAGLQVKTCVLGLRGAGRLFPMLWHFTTRGPGLHRWDMDQQTQGPAH